MLELPVFSSSQQGSMTVPSPTQLRAVLPRQTAGHLVRAWESRAAGNAAFQQTGKPRPGHLWSAKVLGHALKDKNSPLFG